MVTLLVCGILLGFILVFLLLWGLFLRFGLALAKLQNVTTRRVIVATLIAFTLDIAVVVLLSLIPPTIASRPVVQIGFLLLGLMVPSMVVMSVFQVRVGKAIVAWLPTLAVSVAMVGLNAFVVRPFLLEAFRIPSIAMAPTLVGDHFEATCPTCGAKAYCSARDAGSPDGLMICSNFHTTTAEEVQTELDTPPISGDRILVLKPLKPRRWDLVVFRLPEQPATIYVKRLVGLPGEEIVIRGGRVWSNGKELAPPASIEGIEYVSEFPGAGSAMWGTEERPAKLSEGEYFVLGDFSSRSKDARLWETGAPGHPPYAVPKSHFIGVVTHIYWPAERIRSLR